MSITNNYLYFRSEGATNVVYTLSDSHRMDQGDSKMSKPVSVSFSGSAGLMCGEWLSFGAPDLPGDQRVASQFQVLKMFRQGSL